ncbi:MAG: oligosaccharide flippase family protein [Candidatus Brocadiaceae bacterium]|mgnify:CR=1 FL=1|nr:oligosaccharide flippase family protein [Candidatus Brocadiaceae bacterium]
MGTGIAHVLGAMSSIVVARILGKTGFGELGMIRSTVGMFGVFAGLGLGLTATKYVAEFRDTDPTRAGRILGMSTVVAVGSGGFFCTLVFLLTPYLAAHAINAPHLVTELRIACLLLLFNALGGAQRGALAGFEAFGTVATLSLVQGLLSFPLMLVGAYYWDLRGAVIAVTGTAAMGWALNHAAVRVQARRKGVPLTYRHATREMQILWRFSVPAVMGGAMTAPATWGAHAILANQQGGYSELGLFAAASQFKGVLLLVAAPLGSVLLPMLCSREGEASDRFKRVNMVLTWALGVFPALVLIALPELVSLVFGPGYASLHFNRAVVVVTLAACVLMYKQGLARVLASRSLMWWGALSNAFWALLLIVGTLAMRSWGATGLAAAYALAYAVNTAVFVPFYVRRMLVPRSTIVSFEAGIVWMVILVLGFATLCRAPFVPRLLALPLATAVVLWAFVRISGWARPRSPLAEEGRMKAAPIC